MNIKDFWLWVTGLLGKTYLADCGHQTKLVGKMTYNGKDFGHMRLLLQDGKIFYCHQCLSRMTIRCAWCGEPIFIGDPITLYTPTDDKFEVPEHAVIYNQDPLQLVGCMRYHCAITGADRAGFWIPPGKVRRMMSPVEMCFSTGKTIVCSDISDPSTIEVIED